MDDSWTRKSITFIVKVCSSNLIVSGRKNTTRMNYRIQNINLHILSLRWFLTRDAAIPNFKYPRMFVHVLPRILTICPSKKMGQEDGPFLLIMVAFQRTFVHFWGCKGLWSPIFHRSITRWWFHFFNVHPYQGKWSVLTNTVDGSEIRLTSWGW